MDRGLFCQGENFRLKLKPGIQKFEFGVKLRFDSNRSDLHFTVTGSPHVPGRCADELLFVPDDEAEFFVELDILWSVGFEVAGGLLLFEMLDVAMHQCRADALSLSIGSNADGSQMDVGFLGIEMAPPRKPLDDLWNRLAEGFQ